MEIVEAAFINVLKRVLEHGFGLRWKSGDQVRADCHVAPVSQPGAELNCVLTAVSALHAFQYQVVPGL